MTIRCAVLMSKAVVVICYRAVVSWVVRRCRWKAWCSCSNYLRSPVAGVTRYVDIFRVPTLRLVVDMGFGASGGRQVASKVVFLVGSPL
jgi:hypothetical protein